MRSSITAVAVLLLAVAASAFGQDRRTTFFAEKELIGGVSFQTWNSERGDRVSQFVIPLAVVLPVTRTLSLDLSTAGATAVLNTPEEKLGGLADTRLRLNYLMLDETLLLTAGISAPTGRHQLGADQRLVASALASPALDFRMPILGQGPDVNLGAVYAVDLGGIMLGVGAGAILKGTFKPLAGSDAEYRPGSEITITAGADRTFEFDESTLQVTGDLSFTRYAPDEFSGETVFRSGNRITADVRALYSLPSLRLLFTLQNRTKGKNERGLGTLSPEGLNSNGNQLDIGAIGSFPLAERLQGKIAADVRLYAKNEYGTNGALVYGIGAGAGIPLSSTLSLDVLAKYLLGTLRFNNGESSINGVDISAGFRFGF